MQEPVFFTRQVLVKAVFAAMMALSGMVTSETNCAESVQAELVGAGTEVAVGDSVGTAVAVTATFTGNVKTALTPLAMTVYVPAGNPLVLSAKAVSKGVTTWAQPRSVGLTA